MKYIEPVKNTGNLNKERVLTLAQWLAAGGDTVPGRELARTNVEPIPVEAQQKIPGRPLEPIIGFSMVGWRLAHFDLSDKDDVPVCGSVCCLGGTAEALWGEVTKDMSCPSSRAAIALGLDKKAADALFWPPDAYNEDPNGDPIPGTSTYALTPPKVARVLRHLLRTNEVNWNVANED